jgi:hypothetical protein
MVRLPLLKGYFTCLTLYLIWGNSAENRKGRIIRSKSHNIQNYKDRVNKAFIHKFRFLGLKRKALRLTHNAERLTPNV